VRDALRTIGRHPWLEPHVAKLLVARLTTTPARCFVREERGRGRYRYTIRETGTTVVLEHGTPDIATFNQAFYQHAYEPGPRADATLKALGRPLVALDCGANIGMFSVWLASRYPVARVTAVEPLPRNVAALRRNLELALPGVGTVLSAAVTTSNRELHFGGEDFTTGRIREDGGIAVAGRDVFALADGADLVKLDVEGAEWPILTDPRFARLRAPVVMVEHHPHGAPGDAAAAAEELVARAGYEVERTEDGGDGTGVVWGVRPTG
jgi:FkbM family methyltransferase